MAAGQRIDRCPPGGMPVIRRLAHLTGRDVVPLDRSRGEHKAPQVAFIDEDACIGCTLCIQACPVDAIVGAAKRMHTVIAEHCTGCELCLPPCPVDCIVLLPGGAALLERLPGARRARADVARTRHQRRLGRLERERRDHARRMAAKSLQTLDVLDREGEADARKRAIVQTALERAKARLSAIR
jgi:Na+-translocating ferredoxin:NAD+ oxidoreductase subunit B